MKVINLVAGGPSDCLPILRRKSNETWIAVDRGLENLLHFKIEPDYCLGDFDSVSSSLKETILTGKYKQYPSEKDETDLELALSYALNENPDIINIYGATGGRLDHEIVNLQLLLKGIESYTSVFLIDKKNKITIKNPGSYSISKSKFNYISFLSFYEKVEGLTLEGFKYPLDNRQLRCGSSLCLSNELISNIGTFSFSSGILIVVESYD